MAGQGFDMKSRSAGKYDVDQRAALFGKKYSQLSSRDDNKARVQGFSVLENQNDQHIEDLEAKVQSLREISLGIHGAVRESNGLLDGMGSSMESATRSLRGTWTKVQRIIDETGGRHCCTLILVFLGAFFLLWLLFGGSRSQNIV